MAEKCGCEKCECGVEKNPIEKDGQKFCSEQCACGHTDGSKACCSGDCDCGC